MNSKLQYLLNKRIRIPVIKNFEGSSSSEVYASDMEIIDLDEVLNALTHALSIHRVKEKALMAELYEAYNHGNVFAFVDNMERQKKMNELKEKFGGEWPVHYPPGGEMNLYEKD